MTGENTWGGKRPGAGAPKGNLNALKGGRWSVQFWDAFLSLNGSFDHFLQRMKDHDEQKEARRVKIEQAE
jgi:hypothetical protein